MKRIVKKKMAVNSPYNLRTMYVVDGVYICPTKKKAESMLEYLKGTTKKR